MMNTLILSLDTYSWIKNCFGEVSRTPSAYQLYIIFKDDLRQMYYCKKGLYNEALYIQRMHDLFRIGKEIGIKKIYNMNCCEGELTNIEPLLMKLQLSILIGGIRRIIFEDNNVLKVALLRMSKDIELELFSYNPICDYKLKDIVYIDLSDKEIESKIKLSDYMVGIHDLSELPTDSNCEVLYRVR